MNRLSSGEHYPPPADSLPHLLHIQNSVGVPGHKSCVPLFLGREIWRGGDGNEDVPEIRGAEYPFPGPGLGLHDNRGGAGGGGYSNTVVSIRTKLYALPFWVLRHRNGCHLI